MGECRKHDGGTMCPSYMATLEEEHSTRGRARLLFEMLQGEVMRDGVEGRARQASLDLCLSCKACKSECPTNVDIATYRAEFLSHYYEGQRRPLHAYAFGLIDRWLRLAIVSRRRWPTLLASAPGCRTLSTARCIWRRSGGCLDFADRASAVGARSRRAARWARSAIGGGRAAMQRGRPTVILWVDTFNNYFHPETSQAAVEVLEAAGLRRRRSPRGTLCCGRPLYDFGLLDRAKRVPAIRSWTRSATRSTPGCPIVVLEPSCASVFRDELRNLFPTDAARRPGCGRQTFAAAASSSSHGRRRYQPPLSTGRCCSTGTAIRRR